MVAKKSEELDELRRRVGAAVQEGEQAALEAYLAERSALPGPRMNLSLVHRFADVIGEIVARPDPPVRRLEALLDGWAELPLAAAPVNSPREILPGAAVLAYGQVAVSRPEWWGDEITKLHRAAANPRWRTRELVAAGLQRMLAANWPRAYGALVGWLADDNPLVIRAAAAAVAEPVLLRDAARAEQALMLQAGAVDRLAALPPAARQTEAARTLRQALGYTLSVAVAAAPTPGVPLLRQLTTSPDPDVQWIARENWKKHRLAAWRDEE